MRPGGFSPPGIPKQRFSAKSCSARVSSPLYERGAFRIPASVAVEGLNGRTCSFEHPPGRYQIGTGFERLNTEVMRERMNMLVLNWQRRLYFYKKSYAIFIPRVAAPVPRLPSGRAFALAQDLRRSWIGTPMVRLPVLILYYIEYRYNIVNNLFLSTDFEPFCLTACLLSFVF